MKRELKIGDKVRINKPKVTAGTCWIDAMRDCIGEVSIIRNIDNREATLKDFKWWFPLSSLTLVKEATEQVAEQVSNPIDWEKRRWELASKLFSLTSHEQAISSADNFIERYKQTLK